MRRRTLLISAAVLLVLLAVAGAILLRRKAAPEAARLLPEAEGYLYVNLKPMRKAGVFGSTTQSREPEYEQFVRETGFQFERDLDEAAFAIHYPAAADSGGAARNGETRFSEVFIGRFDSARATAYFRKMSRNSERYRDEEIFSIPLEGRTVRVAILGVGMAAVSNADDPQVIHGMVDRYKQVALPFGGPQLVRQYYSHVPLASVGWLVARVAAPSGQSGNSLFVLPGGFDLFFPPDTVVLASVRYLGAIQFRAVAFTGTDEQARRVTDQAGAFLAIFRSLEASGRPSGADQDVKAFFDSFNIQQDKNRAVLTATLPAGFIRKAFSESPTASGGGMPVPSFAREQKAAPPAPAKPKPRRRK